MTHSFRFLRAGRVAVLGLTLLGAPAPSAGEDAASRVGTSRVVWDLVALRPLDIVELGVSLPFLVVAYPVTLLTGGSDHVLEVCWDLPYERAFRRPLGHL